MSLMYHYFKVAGEGQTIFQGGTGEVHKANSNAQSHFYEQYLGGEMDGYVKLDIMIFNPVLDNVLNYANFG